MYYFIVNPNSGGGKGFRVWRKLERVLSRTCVEYEAYFTHGPGDARTIARELTEGSRDLRVIVIAGGDGTMNEAIDGINFNGSVTLGFIPAGTGNDLARSLRLSRSPGRGLRRILHPKYQRLVDYGVLSYGEGEIRHRRFAVSAGIGFDAAVCHSLLHGGPVKLLPGKLRYIAAGIWQMIRLRPAKGYLLLDGVQKVEFNHIYFISAHIQPFEGGGFRFAPGADCSDGLLSLCVVHTSSRLRLLQILLDALTGRKNRRPGVRRYECREASVHLEKPMAVHTDGESCLVQQDIHLRCIQKKMRVII
ncbi:MAG TPA: diacylglycerol kinase family lipid kinase [Candidatus Lachnoclostridium stercorigallinarum]|uniref:Diacylglycerol kinase family lipid kinase n=1 Tax=Candidatus Lachnoclostridium stercorigallinarum TaxID=2838634 RepID=A0A9D2GG17_9FIRM|nr:diacylglycerol kinase family lipid kinase [Candidatus Lachnoclostridium stercorigallinarum]